MSHDLKHAHVKHERELRDVKIAHTSEQDTLKKDCEQRFVFITCNTRTHSYSRHTHTHTHRVRASEEAMQREKLNQEQRIRDAEKKIQRESAKIQRMLTSYKAKDEELMLVKEERVRLERQVTAVEREARTHKKNVFEMQAEIDELRKACVCVCVRCVLTLLIHLTHSQKMDESAREAESCRVRARQVETQFESQRERDNSRISQLQEQLNNATRELQVANAQVLCLCVSGTWFDISH